MSKKGQGFTLIEIIITLIITSIILIVSSQFIHIGFNQYFKTQTIKEKEYETEIVFKTVEDLLKKAIYFKDNHGLIIEVNNNQEQFVPFFIIRNEKQITIKKADHSLVTLVYPQYELEILESQEYPHQDKLKVIRIKYNSGYNFGIRERNIFLGNLIDNNEKK